MAKFLYVTDTHGEQSVYEKMFDLGRGKDIDFLVFGGDITSGVNPNGQKFFLESYLVPRLKEFKKHFGKPVFIMMGNDDFESNRRILRRLSRQKVVYKLHAKYHKIGKFVIVGYPFVNPTPFLLKDWEKEEKEIAKDLERLSRNLSPKKTICIFHAPPFGTKLDMLHGGEHKGSEAIRKFIEKNQPLISLHGHIHESPEVSGTIKQRIGKTLCVNPGNGRIILVDLDKMNIRNVKE